MIVGILKEIKTEENRVCMTPAGVEVMVQHGHTLLVEQHAGTGSGFEDAAYVAAGATIVPTAAAVYAKSDMVMHVKEPLPAEYGFIRPGQIVFTYLHLAADEELTQALIKSQCVGIAYETIQKADGSLPLLTPMAALVASRGGNLSWSILCCTASTTTMASSTTMPMASTRPNRVSVLIEKPKTCKKAKVPTSDTGTVSMEPSVNPRSLR